MKKLLILLLTAYCLPLTFPVSAQDGTPSENSPPVQNSAQGPGISLPTHSKPSKIDLSLFQERAITFSNNIQEPARELFSLFAILALIWTGYHAQFRGLQEFVGTLFRILFTSALILHYQDIIPVIFDAKSALASQLSLNNYDILNQLSAALGTIGTTVTIMSLTGIAAGIALFGLMIIALVIYSSQLLFQAVLVGFGPFAIATLAFQYSRGIFTMWLKTFIAVVLIPIGWLLGSKFFSSIVGAGNVDTLLATIIFVAGFAAIYIGMPLITVSIVNAAGGALAMAMPSLVSAVQPLIGAASFTLGSRFSSGEIMSMPTTRGSMPTGGSTPTVLANTLSMPTSSASKSSDTTSQRAVEAQRWHQQIQSQLKKT